MVIHVVSKTQNHAYLISIRTLLKFPSLTAIGMSDSGVVESTNRVTVEKNDLQARPSVRFPHLFDDKYPSYLSPLITCLLYDQPLTTIQQQAPTTSKLEYPLISQRMADEPVRERPQTYWSMFPQPHRPVWGMQNSPHPNHSVPSSRTGQERP